MSKDHAESFDKEFRQCIVDYNNIGCDDLRYNSKKRIKKLMKRQRNYLKQVESDSVQKMMDPSHEAVSDDEPAVKKRQKINSDLIELDCTPDANTGREDELSIKM